MQAALSSTPLPERRARVSTRALVTKDFALATARALAQGGDTRIELNAAGVNGYGCAPCPDTALVQFGSSTGSVISGAGFHAAQALYRRCHSSIGGYRLEVEWQRQDLSRLTGVDRLPGTQVVLAASGTDIHLIAAHLATQGAHKPLQAVMVDPAETGSGVPAALAARHFASQTSQGRAVRQGTAVARTAMRQPACVALRHADGSLRSAAEVDAEFVFHVARQMQTDGRCLLVLTDLSKTGLLAPSLACATQLQRLYGEQLTVLVDACQFRLSSASLLAYLAQDFMVAITGSKFLGGPAFCGALLLPPSVAHRSCQVPLETLADYSSRFDWPPGWLPARVLQETANLGQLLRWEAALVELRQFRAIPDRVVHDFLQTWQHAVARRLSEDDTFEVLPVASLHRETPHGSEAWDSVQTIFPFLVCKRSDRDGRQMLSQDDTAQLFRQMRQTGVVHSDLFHCKLVMNTRFQLGQPVPCGYRDGRPVSALRMCASARLVTESMRLGQSVDQAVAQAMLAFDKLAILAQALR